MAHEFRHVIIPGMQAGELRLLDAVSDDGAAYLFVSGQGLGGQGRKAADIDVTGVQVGMRRGVGGGLLLAGARDPSGAPVRVAQTDITLHPADHGFFAGQNVIMAERNFETAEATIDWLRYHSARCNMTAALILNRAEPGQDDDDIARIRDAARDLPGLERLMIVAHQAPLGQPNMPAENHPITAPSAPGKDRMKTPPVDPRRAPLGEFLMLEALRRRYLGRVPALISVDISDLLPTATDGDVFAMAREAAGAWVALDGIPVYPWRLRKGKPPRFGDHICRQFDLNIRRRRWAVAPDKLGTGAVLRAIRVGKAPQADLPPVPYYRAMTMRYGAQSVAKIVPKTSLVENEDQIAFLRRHFNSRAARMPEITTPADTRLSNRVTVVTTMKNEGPFILEWLAYHRAIGISDFLVYTNDCTDGTDTMLALLQSKGIVQHRENPFRNTDLKPQHAALQAAEEEEMVKTADWVLCMDVDEYINIHTGDGTLAALFRAIGDANMISMTWRLFGNSDIHAYHDRPIIGQMTRCAPQIIRKPHQAWGFKTLFRNLGIFKKLGVHRPKGLNTQLWKHINWVNGSGRPMPHKFYRNAWRSTNDTVGYDLVTLNHYAVRSAESFLVKRDRGRVNHVDRDQGLAYWFRMNNNAEEDRSIQRMLPKLQQELDRLLADPEIRAAHEHAVSRHRAKIAELRQSEEYTRFYKELTGPRMERLSRMHAHFGANVFLAGPQVIPNELLSTEMKPNFFFTVERKTTSH